MSKSENDIIREVAEMQIAGITARRPFPYRENWREQHRAEKRKKVEAALEPLIHMERLRLIVREKALR